MGKDKTEKGQKTFRGIEKQLFAKIVGLVAITCLILGAVAVGASYSSGLDALEKTINEASALAADRVTAELKEYKSIAYETGSIARLADAERAIEDKKAIIQQRIDDHNFTNGTILDSTGWDLFAEIDLSDRVYFKEAMAGNTYTTTPTVSRVTGELTMMVAAPLWQDGIPHTAPIGAIVYTPQPDFLNQVVASIQIGKSGTAFIVDKEGNIIAHTDSSKAGNVNYIEMAKTDNSVKDEANIVTQMIEYKDGFGNYSEGGSIYMVSFSPISETDGWSIAIVVKRAEFLVGFFIALICAVVAVIVLLLVGIRVAKMTGRKMAEPIILAADRIKLLAEGDLHTEVPVSDRNDETTILLNSTRDTIEELNEIIDDIDRDMGTMAEGNFALKIGKMYAGDFKSISESEKKIVEALGGALSKIDANADVVSESAQSLSTASQALADGATDQASSIEELTATVTEIAEKIGLNAEHAKEANGIVGNMNKKIQKSNEEMQEMTTAMDRIKETSNQIAMIIKTIEDIASQTNLLALNASIEAARAGEAGKGFAVVAEEVGSLADQSVAAAKNTAQLISNAIEAVESGNQIVEQTAASLNEVVEDAKNVRSSIESIADASQRQAEAARQITDAVNQISAVVQENSATAEESAATSEELSAEAIELKQQVERFKY